MAPHPKPLKPVRSERSDRASRKLGGPLGGANCSLLLARTGSGFTVPEEGRGLRTVLSLQETKVTKCGRRNPLMTDRLSEEDPVIAGWPNRRRAGCAEDARTKAARTAFLNVVKLVKGCREKPEKSFRNLSE
jgi:hypothetical protein